MASKAFIHKLNLIDSGSTAGVQNSDSTDLLGLNVVSYQVVATGTSSSVATIQVSNDNSNFSSSSATVTLSNTGVYFVELETSARYVRLNLTLSGTAVVDVHVCGKSL
jgi:hypothetical protein